MSWNAACGAIGACGNGRGKGGGGAVGAGGGVGAVGAGWEGGGAGWASADAGHVAEAVEASGADEVFGRGGHHWGCGKGAVSWRELLPEFADGVAGATSCNSCS